MTNGLKLSKCFDWITP